MRQTLAAIMLELDTHDHGTFTGKKNPGLQPIQRAGQGLNRFGGDLGLNCRRFQLGVPEQHLNDADIGATLQQMCGKAVPQSMGRHLLLDLRKAASHPKGLIELAR